MSGPTTVEEVLNFFNRYDVANRGFIDASKLGELLEDCKLGGSLSSAQTTFTSARVDKFDFIGWWNKQKTKSSSGGADKGMAEQTFINMLGSRDAEANIKQFATAVEKLGYEWDASLLRGVFDRIDNSGDGMVDIDEFANGIKLVAGTQMFKEMDADKSGMIELPEFLATCRKLNPNFRETQARDAFAKVDCDNSGELDVMEFLDAVTEMERGGPGGFGSLGFGKAIQEQMGALKKKMAEAEKKMNQLKGSLKTRGKEKTETEAAYKSQKAGAREKQAELDKLAAQMAPQQQKLGQMAGQLAPLREQLEENMKEFGAKRAELDEAFQENDWGKIRPISNELKGLKATIGELEGKLGITQDEHDKLMEKFTALGASHGVTQDMLDEMHRGVEDAQGSMDRALAAHADDLEAFKATSAEYRQLKRNLLQCQIKEKKAEISDTLGKLNQALSAHKRASNKIKAACAAFSAAEEQEEYRTCSDNCDILITQQKVLDEADSTRHEDADQLKRLRSSLADEKNGLAALDDLPPPTAD